MYDSYSSLRTIPEESRRQETRGGYDSNQEDQCVQSAWFGQQPLVYTQGVNKGLGGINASTFFFLLLESLVSPERDLKGMGPL